MNSSYYWPYKNVHISTKCAIKYLLMRMFSCRCLVFNTYFSDAFWHINQITSCCLRIWHHFEIPNINYTSGAPNAVQKRSRLYPIGSPVISHFCFYAVRVVLSLFSKFFFKLLSVFLSFCCNGVVSLSSTYEFEYCFGISSLYLFPSFNFYL